MLRLFYVCVQSHLFKHANVVKNGVWPAGNESSRNPEKKNVAPKTFLSVNS